MAVAHHRPVELARPTAVSYNILMRLPLTIVLMGCALSVASPHAGATPPKSGHWRAWLDCPGGELPFGLDLRQRESKWTGWIINGPERISIPRVTWDGSILTIDIDHYDSTIRATLSADGTELNGTWRKKAAGERWSQLEFHARAGDAKRFPMSGTPSATPAEVAIAGRWSVKFSSSEDLAVGIFETRPDQTVTGTFLTTTGDYRYLAGVLDAGRLRLSCFDGAHAFLFDARVRTDGTLAGDFWSRDSWHETWTARRDATAALADGFFTPEQTGPLKFSDMIFRDLDGRPRSLAETEFAGRVRIIEIFGSWCPNCHDAAAYLVDLDRRYRSRGVTVTGLAFELTGDAARDARQVRRFAKRHKIKFPLLLAGLSDKKKAAAALPMLDELKAYPTLIVVDDEDRIVTVHTGFSGPATGEAFDRFRNRFESILDGLLATE